MDYRLVKQYLNDAIDNFFNFFYKIGDFGKVLADTALAFFDIWYNFFMFFINLFLYAYYLFLFWIDRMSMSSAPIFFWRRKGEATRKEFARAYNRNAANPVSGMYGRRKSSGTLMPSGTISSTAGASGGFGTTASSSQKAASSVVASHVSVRRNIFVSFFRVIGSVIAAVFGALFGVFKRIWDFILIRLKPVKDKPVGRKNLIDDYMKQYETKKK